MIDRYPYPDAETKQNCLDRLRESNHQLELYNLFLDDAIAKMDAELPQHRCSRLSQKKQPTEQAS
jgi:hypothetical protein